MAVFFAAGLWAGWRQKPLEKPFLADTQVYYYIAEQVADGVPPHVSLIDHKHQLSSLISGYAIRAGRIVGMPDPLAVRVASLTAAALTVSACAWLGAELSGSLLGGVIAGLTMIAFTEFFYEAAMGVRPHSFMACFMTLGLVAFVRRRYVAAAVCATSSFLCWQPAALVGAAFALVASAREDRFRVVPRLAGGAIAAILLYEIYFLMHGALAVQIGQSYRMASELGGYKYAGFFESIAFFSSLGMGGVFRTAWLIPGLLLACTATATVGLLLLPFRALRLCREDPALAAFFLMSILNVGFTFVTHDAHPDMFFVEPLMAVMVALATVRLPAALFRRRQPALRAALTAVVAVWLVWVQQGRVRLISSGAVRLSDQIDLAKQLDVLRDGYGSVWAVGCPHLLGLAHMKNWHPLGLLLDPKVRDYVTREGPRGERYPGSDGRLPGAIIVSRVGVFAWFPELRRHYRRVPNASFDREKVVVWAFTRATLTASLH